MDFQQLFSALAQWGADVPDALGRFMGNRSLYLSFLLRFPEQVDLPAMERALAEGRGDSFYAQVHALKGMAGNLSLSPILRPTQRILAEYRSHALERPAVIRDALGEIASAAVSLEALLKPWQPERKGGSL